MKKKLNIPNKAILLAFVLASLLATFHKGHEFFPIFNWALFSEAPKKFRYKKLLVTLEACRIYRRPLNLLFEKNSPESNELHTLSNLYGKNPDIIKEKFWKERLLGHVQTVCGTTSGLKIEFVQLIADPLKLWNDGTIDDVEKIIKLYTLSEKSL